MTLPFYEMPPNWVWVRDGWKERKWEAPRTPHPSGPRTQQEVLMIGIAEARAPAGYVRYRTSPAVEIDKRWMAMHGPSLGCERTYHSSRDEARAAVMEAVLARFTERALNPYEWVYGHDSAYGDSATFRLK